MHPPILSNEHARAGLVAPAPPAILLVALLWLTFACGLPLYQLHEARRQARQDLQGLFATDKPEQASVVAAFDRSNQNLDAVASGPCLMLACSSIFLVNQLLKLKRRYHALALDLSAAHKQGPDPDEAGEN